MSMHKNFGQSFSKDTGVGAGQLPTSGVWPQPGVAGTGTITGSVGDRVLTFAGFADYDTFKAYINYGDVVVSGDQKFTLTSNLKNVENNQGTNYICQVDRPVDVALAAAAYTLINLKETYKFVRITNIGGADGTVNGGTLKQGETMEFQEDSGISNVIYDASSTTFRFDYGN